MLGGLDPVIIFQFSSLVGTQFGDLIKKIPIANKSKSFLDQPPIPIYLNSNLTGLYINNEDKSVDISTDVETLQTGDEPLVSQKGISSNVTISFQGKKTSVGLIALSALIDLAFNKVTSDEYAITYLSGATTIFRARLQSYNVTQSPDNDLLFITVVLTVGAKDAKKPTQVQVLNKQTGTQVLQAP